MNIFSSRYFQASLFYIANHFFMNFPSYTLRHYFLRKACGIRLGKQTSIHMGCFITGRKITIGDNSVINRGVYLDGRAGIVIGDRVNVSHKVLIQSLSHDPQCPHFNCVVKPVTIGDYSWIGARVLFFRACMLARVR